MTDEKLIIGGREIKSRLMVGTGKYADNETMEKALEASGTDIVTVAIGRVDLNSPDNLLDHVDLSKYTLLPNTAGAFSVEDALRISRLAREACGTDLIKLEVLGDKTTLLPDVHGTVKACEILVKEGFTVLPYTNDDPITARMLEDAGAAAIMPLASMIGSGHGVLDLTGIKLIRAQTRLPVVVDAGIGVPSDVCLSFEIGADAVLINTAIACAADPVMMATAMKKATKAGRLGYLAGRITKKEYGQVSSVGAGFGS